MNNSVLPGKKIGKLFISVCDNTNPFESDGWKISTLVSKMQPSGTYETEWNASSFSSGVYFYRLKTSTGFVQTKKLILLR